MLRSSMLSVQLFKNVCAFNMWPNIEGPVIGRSIWVGGWVGRWVVEIDQRVNL